MYCILEQNRSIFYYEMKGEKNMRLWTKAKSVDIKIYLLKVFSVSSGNIVFIYFFYLTDLIVL